MIQTSFAAPSGISMPEKNLNAGPAMCSLSTSEKIGPDGGLELLKVHVNPLFLQKDAEDALFDDEEVHAGLFELDAKLAEVLRRNFGESRQRSTLRSFQRARARSLILFLSVPVFS